MKKFEATKAFHEKMQKPFINMLGGLNQRQEQTLQRILQRHKELK